MQLERFWNMPSKWTFTIPAIKKLIAEEVREGEIWIDPFAGMNSPAKHRNDINPNANARTALDALIYLKQFFPPDYADGILLDPPYSNNQYRICYQEAGVPINPAVFNARYWAQIKDETARIVKKGGKAICFGWNSNGIGKCRGFYLERLLIVAHGRQHNDTLVTVERKL